MTTTQFKRARTMYLRGFSLIQVSQKLGIAISTIRFRLYKLGLLRTLEEARKLAIKNGRYSWRRSPRGPMSKEQRAKMSRAALRRGERTARGWRKSSRGYIEFTRGPNKGRLQHRVVMEESIGRLLLPTECVHHDNHDRTDNRLSNLTLMTRAEHARLHAIEANPRRTRNTKGQYQ